MASVLSVPNPFFLNLEIPPERIAQVPVNPRDHSRLMVVSRSSGEILHARFLDLPRFLQKSDLLLFNNSRVLKARLYPQLANGSRLEVFLLGLVPESLGYPCLVKPGRKVREETSIQFAPGETARVKRQGDRFFLDFEARTEAQIHALLEKYGSVPIPPYLKRSAQPEDASQYQTVYAETEGSVAAPTAGLHFTHRLLEELRDKEIHCQNLTLHVGWGTFAPLTQPWPERLHPEWFSVPVPTQTALAAARTRGGRVFAVGTTSLRALETAAREGKWEGWTELFLHPGNAQVTAIDGLITNFHLPDSSLLQLVATFLGDTLTQRCYEEALRSQYRFYSYGDAMLILP